MERTVVVAECLIGLGLFYVWLRGWWFAGLIVFGSLYIMGDLGHSDWPRIEQFLPMYAAISFGPWIAWKVWRHRAEILASMERPAPPVIDPLPTLSFRREPFFTGQERIDGG